jgi:DNA-binding PadR family transcriptional regulator
VKKFISDYIYLNTTRVNPSRFLMDMHKRIVRDFLDILILAELQKGPMSGYDVIGFVHDKYRLLISSGTVYSVMYSLERKGLISGVWTQRKRVYKLTEGGEKTIMEIINAKDPAALLVSSLLKLDRHLHSEGCGAPVLGHSTPSGI